MAVQVDITGEEKVGQVTYYTISVQEGSRGWTVSRRYNDFVALNEDLIGEGLERKELPSKGLMGLRHRLNLGTFNAERRVDLEQYLKTLAGQIKSLRDIGTIEQFLLYADEASVVPVSRETSPDGRRTPSEATRKSSEAPRREVVERRAPSPESVVTTKSQPERGNRARSPEVEDSKRGYDQNAKPGASSAPSAKQAEAFQPLGVVVETGVLQGPEWEAFRKRHPDLAKTMETCFKMLFNLALFENNCEDVFKDLRRHLRNLRNDASALDSVPAKAMVWNFLLLVAERRQFFRNQAAEVANILLTSEDWRNALNERAELGVAKARMMGE